LRTTCSRRVRSSRHWAGSGGCMGVARRSQHDLARGIDIPLMMTKLRRLGLDADDGIHASH
jgi:hypothetical protein